eukprot:scaffold1659_cov371-Prasinococcus_capsulatus_cf.AAC.1
MDWLAGISDSDEHASRLGSGPRSRMGTAARSCRMLRHWSKACSSGMYPLDAAAAKNERIGN